MTLGELIYAAVTGNAAASALLGTRIYPNRRPQAAQTFPLAVYSIVSDVPYNSFTGTAQTRLSRARLQVDVYARTYLEAQRAAQAVDDVIANLTSPDLSGDRDVSRDLYEDETELHRVETEYIVNWSRS